MKSPLTLTTSSLPRPLVTRKGAYLLTWSLAYIALSPILASAATALFAPLFTLAGVFAFVGAFSRPSWFGRVAFALLTVAPTILAIGYWVLAIQGILSEDFANFEEGLRSPVAGNIFRAILWWAVAVNHYIVAGWPESRTRSRSGECNGH